MVHDVTADGERTGRTLVIRNGRVLTLDPELGVLESADVFVRDGVIEWIGRGAAVEADETIDADGHIVMPGLVDTHTHLWNGVWRSFEGTAGEETDYGTLGVRMSPLFTPDDSYDAVLAAALEMISCGVTTVHNWAHNMLTPEHADAEARALVTSGIRARLSYGYHWNMPRDEVMALDDVVRLRDEFGSDMLSVGIALRNDNTNSREPGLFPTLSVPRGVLLDEVAFARANRLPLTQHMVKMGPAGYWIDAGYVGPDNLMVHGYSWTVDDWRELVAAGVRMSVAPYAAMRSWGVHVPLGEMLDCGVPTSLSFDTMHGPGCADMFRLMQLLRIGERMRSGTLVPFSEMLRLATVDGATVLDLGDRVGSLTVGKRADLVVVRTDELTTAPAVDPTAVVVNSAGPSAVRDVVVDGRVLKRDGVLTSFDARSVAGRVTAMSDRLLRRYQSS